MMITRPKIKNYIFYLSTVRFLAVHTAYQSAVCGGSLAHVARPTPVLSLRFLF